MAHEFRTVLPRIGRLSRLQRPISQVQRFTNRPSPRRIDVDFDNLVLALNQPLQD